LGLGGVIAGLGIIAGTIIIVATMGISSPIGAIVAGAAITTGAITTYAAATDSAMVADLSYSHQTPVGAYAKGGVSLVIDFNRDEANLYIHGGGGYGYSYGPTYSVGIIDNYDDPQDYAGHFADVSAGYNVGIDHCWTPQDGIKDSTQATSITFASGGSFGTGYDYYSNPVCMAAW